MSATFSSLAGWSVRNLIVFQERIRTLKKPCAKFAIPIVATLALLGSPIVAQPLDAKLFAEKNSFVALASQVTPSVVNIDVEKRQAAFSRFFGDRYQQPERVLSGKGSGVILSAEGIVLTNHHVVDGATDIQVTLHDGRRLSGRVLGSDASTDVAVVKVETESPLPAARIGSSADLPIGSWVMAVGNPYGLEETVTVGILSGKGRDIGVGLYDDFLQTDAAINPGNSGGGLFNSEGQLVGINTAVKGQNLGFAIPIEMAQRVASQLATSGKVSRGFLGVGIQTLTPELRRALKVPDQIKGALLGQILPDGPAAKAGFEPGDLVTEFNGAPVEGEKALLGLVAQAKVGQTVPVKVWRKGASKSLSTSVVERPGPSERAPEVKPSSSAGPESRQLGFRGSDLTAELASRLGVEARQGVVVLEVRPGGRADRAGLRRGDVILEIDGQAVTGFAQFERLASAAKEPVALLVGRGEQQRLVAL